MTKQKIMRKIKEENNNSSVKWSVVENTPERIVITNDYDKGINYSIEVRREDMDEWIRVIDNLNASKVAIYVKYYDYDHTEEGLLKGVLRAVHHFNYHY